MNRILRILLLILIIIALAPIKLSAKEKDRCEEMCDEGRAREWCDRTPLHRLEGIWEFPEDETRVLIKRRANSPAKYDLIVVRTPDCRMKAGDIIGSLSARDGNGVFELSLHKNPGSKPLSDIFNCKATLSSDGATIAVEEPKWKVSLRNLSILPRFMRMLRVSVDNPAEKSKRGILRVYPEEHSNLEIIYY